MRSDADAKRACVAALVTAWILRLRAWNDYKRWCAAMTAVRKTYKRYETAKAYAAGCKVLMVDSSNALKRDNHE